MMRKLRLCTFLIFVLLNLHLCSATDNNRRQAEERNYIYKKIPNNNSNRLFVGKRDSSAEYPRNDVLSRLRDLYKRQHSRQRLYLGKRSRILGDQNSPEYKKYLEDVAMEIAEKVMSNRKRRQQQPQSFRPYIGKRQSGARFYVGKRDNNRLFVGKRDSGNRLFVGKRVTSSRSVNSKPEIGESFNEVMNRQGYDAGPIHNWMLKRTPSSSYDSDREFFNHIRDLLQKVVDHSKA